MPPGSVGADYCLGRTVVKFLQDMPVLTAAGMGFGKIAQPLRAAVTSTAVSPELFEVLELIGKERAVAR